MYKVLAEISPNNNSTGSLSTSPAEFNYVQFHSPTNELLSQQKSFDVIKYTSWENRVNSTT
jgi:hypothetical protein